ncbi:uncharacterized protein KY384_009252 [Bacidia gigantensis]|uniref:uncharacterized protein n=1 Tax=Bacidia gigantensis TaxID=2732470 RepID=UPI001D043709|nr:uncharacterized protein KY384_009252 [Bacidia gigantensis]KAG8525608.1 hypothetical protein KY384_009252 [Bacidia gigantensis]
MHSINPYLRAFFKSNLPSQCSPVTNHILLVPTTDCLFAGRDREANATYTEVATSEDFLASHVLRIRNTQAPGEGSIRDSRGKAKQYDTFNGRTVVVKESFVYSNKGFRNLNQAQLLSDQLFYSDSLEQQQWLIYYISKPLVGSYEPIKITPAILPDILRGFPQPSRANGIAQAAEPAASPSEERKHVEGFNDLMNQFPMIARHMHPGLDKIFKDFARAMNDWVPSSPSQRSTTSKSSSSVTLNNNGSIHSGLSNGRAKSPSIARSQLVQEADYMRTRLENAVNNAVELFQNSDKHQLTLLGSSTQLTGLEVDRMIERFVTEQLHEPFLFPRLCNSSMKEDLELESRIHSLQSIDVAQVGIDIENGRQNKDQLISRITKGVEEFRKLGVSGGPQQMIDILLATQKIVTGQSKSGMSADAGKDIPDAEKPPPQTMNADTLVSLLLMVVIRSQVRHLHARLTYMRDFNVYHDVDSGEAGYTLSTFEAVLSYLSSESVGLKKASLRNKRLWQATKRGDIDTMREILEFSDLKAHNSILRRSSRASEEAIDDHEANFAATSGFSHESKIEPSRQSSLTPTEASYASEASTLAHVYPLELTEAKRPKKVTIDRRSLSNASEYSYLSRTTTIDSTVSAIEGDTSVETLAQTQDIDSNSVPMMAVESRQAGAFEYLLSCEGYFPMKFILEDEGHEGTTLLSAAVQLNAHDIIHTLLRRLLGVRDRQIISQYFARADHRGRTVAHYLFNAPWLLPRIGEMLPWTQKDKIGQTPLLALCRSYDHPDYLNMVDAALHFSALQDRNKQLHLDDHVDAKSNTLLHVVNDAAITVKLLQCCDTDTNATNDKRFTPLMLASKFGRLDVVRALFGDARVDFLAKEHRGLTAVELAKDDEIRNRIDDMVLVSNVPQADGRVTAIVRSFFVEDASVRMIIKSATRNENMISVTAGRRSLTDFENLAKWLALELPASWLPSIFNFRSPFQIASRPSKAILEDIQTRLDKFINLMLSHSTFSTHESLWEFLLFPEIQPDMMAERSRKKAEIRAENVREEYEPVEDVRDVASFVEHARESIRGIDQSTKSVTRRVANIRLGLSSTSLLLIPACSSLTTFH